MKKEKLVKEDVGLLDDLEFGLRHLIGLEDHLVDDIESTGDKIKVEALELVRSIRTKYLSLIVNGKNQEWCELKHCLASSMALIEVGTRFVSSGQEKEAIECFKDSKKLTHLGFILNKIEGGKNVSKNATTSA